MSHPRRLGGFRLLRVLGRGGFGTVYLGVDEDGRQAAVKLLHEHLSADREVRRRFAAELDLAQRVSEFCVAEILEADARAERPWIAAEYVEGPTLAEAVAAKGPRIGTELSRLAVNTATALVAMHAAGVVHRDLKPENIILGDGGPRVIDFGIARGLEGASTEASAIVGTVGYMAPEQLEGQRLTAAADIFSWGAVMVFAATGRVAFPGPSQAARITRTLTGEPDLGRLRDPLRGTVHDALSKWPRRRPDARTLLDRLLGGEESPADDVTPRRTATQRDMDPAPHRPTLRLPDPDPIEPLPEPDLATPPLRRPARRPLTWWGMRPRPRVWIAGLTLGGAMVIVPYLAYYYDPGAWESPVLIAAIPFGLLLLMIALLIGGFERD